MKLSTRIRRAVFIFSLTLPAVVFFYWYSCISITKKGTNKSGARGFRKHNTNDKKASSTESAEGYENIMEMNPITYLPNFKNPCWIGTIENGPINDKKMHCLPYFYIIGTKKCGTTDLFYRIIKHPDVVSPGFKESQWFPTRRFNLTTRVKLPGHLKKGNGPQDYKRLEYYIYMFDKATQQIKLNQKAYNYRNTNNILVTGEGTPTNHNHGLWDLLPENKGLSEPRYTILHYIRHLMPDIKIIFSFRNPVDSYFSNLKQRRANSRYFVSERLLYSDFLHNHRDGNTNSSVFHNYVVSTILMYQECFNRSSFRRCMFNVTLINKTKPIFEFQAGFYAFHMKEIRKVFSNDQVLPVLFNEYMSDMQATLERVYKFLGLRKLPQAAWENILQSAIGNNGAKTKQSVGPMLNLTIALLERFYRPYNEEMAKLMNDDRYLFRKYSLNP